jgi:hypothetical protein
MSAFNLAFSKNFIKLTLITIAALSSTLGLRTELTIILDNIFTATWLAISWVFIIVAVIAYYKAKQDVELSRLKDYEKNRMMLGLAQDKPIYTSPVQMKPLHGAEKTKVVEKVEG